MKESEAKLKTCPFVALLAISSIHVAAVLGKTNKKLEESLSLVDPFCLGSQCMMWKKKHDYRGEPQGLCGLPR